MRYYQNFSGLWPIRKLECRGKPPPLMLRFPIRLCSTVCRWVMQRRQCLLRREARRKQMVLTGWMHGYLRCTGPRKILEWSVCRSRLHIAVRLNDRYELDKQIRTVMGNRPRDRRARSCGGSNGPSTARYAMSYASTSRKFDSGAYIANIEALQR